MGRRIDDRLKGRLMLIAFVLNMLVCVWNTHYIRQFITLIDELKVAVAAAESVRPFRMSN